MSPAPREMVSARGWQVVHEDTGVNVETICNANDRFEAQAPLPALDFAELCPVNVAQSGRSLLAQSEF